MSKQYLYPVYETNAWHSLEHRECKGIYTSKEEAKYVSEIVGHEVEASVGAVSKALDDYVEEHEEDNPDLFYSFHEFTVLES